MRLTAILTIAAIVIGGLYAVSPLIAAHKLRHAIKSSDTNRLSQMVDWRALRSSVRATVSKNANLLPVANQIARSNRPTIWQRVRSVFGHSMLDRFIETYITPEGLSQLYRAKDRWHNNRFRGGRAQNQVAKAAIIPEQFGRTWRRVRRAEFESPFRFVIEIQDRHKATRFIESTFELSDISISGFNWKLVGLSIRNTSQDQPRLAKLNGF